MLMMKITRTKHDSENFLNYQDYFQIFLEQSLVMMNKIQNENKMEMKHMNLIEEAEASGSIEYMRSMRDAWQREAEALRDAMHRWADRARNAEEQLEHIHASASTIQAHMKPIRKLTPIKPETEPQNLSRPLRQDGTPRPILGNRVLTPSSKDPMEAKGARLALEQEEEVVEKPFREVLRELHEWLIQAKKDSPKETGTWEERQVREQARRIAQEADEVVDAQHSNYASENGGGKSGMKWGRY